MAGLAAPPGFGGNRWGEVDWSRFGLLTNPPFTVGNSGDWKPSINTGANRTMNIASGIGQAYGVYDRTDTTETITFAANVTGTDRYDALVARFNWTTKTRTFVVIPGTSSPPGVNSTQTLDVSQINRIPGVRYDALIAIVRIPNGRTIFQPGDLYSDMRTWGGATGPMVSSAISATYSLLHVPIGGQVQVSGLEVLSRTPSASLVSIRPRGLAVGVGEQTIQYDSETTVVLDNPVIQSGGVVFNTVTGRVTFTETGDYRISGTLWYNFSANYGGWRAAALARNGTTLDYTWGNVFPTSANSIGVHTANALLHIGAGDYITLVAHHMANAPTGTTTHTAVLNRARCQLSVTYEGA